MQPSPLNEIIKADVEDVTQSLLKDTVEPWIFFRSHGVHIKKVDGSSIAISGGEYSVSAESVAKTPLFFKMKWNEKRGVIYLGYHS